MPLTQPLANLVIAAMEPDTQNGFVANRIIAGVDQLARVRVPPGEAGRGAVALVSKISADGASRCP